MAQVVRQREQSGWVVAGAGMLILALLADVGLGAALRSLAAGTAGRFVLLLVRSGLAFFPPAVWLGTLLLLAVWLAVLLRAWRT